MTISTKPGRRAVAASLLAAPLLAAPLLCAPALHAQTRQRLRIVIFGAPSLGAILPAIIKARQLDAAHGLDIEFVERTPDAYATEFNAGEFDLGGSASVLTVGIARARGVDPVYLFNLFDFWGAVVTANPAIKTLTDLAGHSLAAAHGTTNFQMFAWFAKQAGLDLAKVSVINTATPGLIGYALANRADAVQLWEPAYTVLIKRKPDLRTLDLGLSRWKDFAGSTDIPYLGVAAHQSWIARNPTLVAPLFAAYQDAAKFLAANPDEAAHISSGGGTAETMAAVAALYRANDRLGMNLRLAGDQDKAIRAVYRAGRELGILPPFDEAATIYAGAGH
jgi:NitT/TauT family transport system substrate-binding protein